MNRFTSRVLCGLGLLALACNPQAKRQNVLFISIDTLRADHLGAYGYARGTSPNIDAFANTATVFENAQSSASWTLPSLTSLMTSLYSSTHGCWKIQSRLDPSFHTLAEMLRDAGYDTAMVASHTFLGGRYGLQQGFTHVDTRIVQTDMDITSPDVTEKGIQWLDAKAAVKDGVPWFLWLHYFDPHGPYLLHEGISERFGTEKDIDRYDGEIAFTDIHVGRLLDELAKQGLDRDTIVVLVADHGEEFGEHGNHGHGYALYQEVVHVPLIVRVPGVPAARVTAVVPTVDLMPTLLELCGVSSDVPVEGVSLSSALSRELRRADPARQSDPNPAPPFRAAVSEVRWQAGQDMRSLRSGSWKYIEHRNADKSNEYLFDLDLDPNEQVDVLAEHTDRASELRATLAQRLKRAREMSASYRVSAMSELSPSERDRLSGLGYTGDD